VRRKLAISFFLALLLTLGAIVAYLLLPKHYLVGERLSYSTVFWNDKEAFVFLNVLTLGRSQNAVQSKIAASQYGWLMSLAGMDFNEQQLTAYHLQASGKLEHPSLPENTSSFGSWRLVDGKLQLTTFANGYNNANGLRWDGTRFQSLAPQPKSLEGHGEASGNLSEDDLDSAADDRGSNFLEPAERKKFKAAGWHYKTITGYEANGGDATLPIALGHSKFSLNLRSTIGKTEEKFLIFSRAAPLESRFRAVLSSTPSCGNRTGGRSFRKLNTIDASSRLRVIGGFHQGCGYGYGLCFF